MISLAKMDGLDKTKIDGYREIHHIVPRCMGGLDDDNNLVLLTAKEHYLCHGLLFEIYRRTEYASKLACAFNMMTIGRDGCKLSLLEISLAREYFSLNHPMKLKENRQKLSESLRQFYSNLDENGRQALSDKRIAYWNALSEEDRQLVSDKQKQVWERMTQAQREEFGLKITESLLEYYKNESEEDKIKRLDLRKTTCLTSAANEKRSGSLKHYVSSLSENRQIERMEMSVWNCDHVKRGKSISEGKKGKKTNQQEIMGKKYAEMSDVDFENYLFGRNNKIVARMMNLRERYKCENSNN